MKKFKENIFLTEIIFNTLFLFGIEVIFRSVLNLPFFDYATLRIFLSSLFLGIVIEWFLFFIKKKRVREILWGIILLVASCYAWAQAGFRNFLGIFISVGTSSQFGAVTSYVKEFLMSYHWEYYFIFIPFLLYIYYFFISKKANQKMTNSYSLKAKISGIISLILIGACYVSTLFLSWMQNPLQLVENKKLFLSPLNSSVAVSQFGTSLFALLDIRQSIFPIHVLEEFEDTKEQETKRSFDDTNWKKLISLETDPYRNSLNRYFINRPITDINEYTGYFENKNVIVIMMESISNIITMEEYFPNFHKLLEHGWYFENNYSPRNACATGDNEFSGMTSLYPLNTSCTVNVYPENSYFTSIFRQFRQKGYTTSSYHDLDSTYYARDIFHQAMGSEEYYDGNRLNISFDSTNYLEWPSDVELMEKATSIFTQKKPFMAWITTVTAHQPYDDSSVNGDKYISLFENTEYSMTLKRYLSKAKVTDDALGTLLNSLEQHNALKDTVIVLYGDHYPYGLSDEDVQMVSPFDINEFYEIEQTPFLIYQSDLEPKVFTNKTFYMNILPTLANLFNLDYDPRFYLGEDLFSSSFSGRVVFADGSWEDDVARYNAVDSSITYFSDKTYTNQEIQKINMEIYQKKEMSKLAITNNYFDYLETSLKEMEEEKQEEKDE